ncbi:helix-turn-helix domain-containing protein [Brevundimonas sp.]|jgi:transcriptional regulator with XRE-family HTH domain|uniref:helix-turn-helix domain-containing protein n=1 Tax=Brevundimonas sp. TaxID=1871086 RepID=UPI002BEF8544|nr:helix-turn-helix domain-containing protein [Brevundimonas sp.]HWQ86884.1 helix-turn-helix domain-containing protein [Brevundimonas sp.]
MSLASKLKDLRIKSGESLQQVADGIGVSKAHIWQLERGDSTNPSLDLLRGLADHFKVTVAFLSDDTKTPDEAAALQFFREFEGKLDDKAWEAVRNVAEALKKP